MALPSGGTVAQPRLRPGVTELTALTWLPDLVARVRSLHPLMILEPVVDMSRSLFERLYDDVVDIIIIPDAFSDPQITALPFGPGLKSFDPYFTQGSCPVILDLTSLIVIHVAMMAAFGALFAAISWIDND